VLEGHEFVITGSIGIAVYPHDAEDAESLLRSADLAMYRAKERGGDDYQVCTPAIHAGILEQLDLENDLRRALQREEFVLHYQPQVDGRTGRICGVEALLRWQHPERGRVQPQEFIALAEKSGLIVRLGEWVLRTACAQNRAWREAGLLCLPVAVNVSPVQLQQPDLAETVARALEETGLAPACLRLEITEGAVMQDAKMTINVLRDLRELGVEISVDDFGTGYSSLSYLKRLPIDEVKIDRSFVHDVPGDPDDAAIVAAIIALAQALNLRVVAEGVETQEQLAFLRERGCHVMQGYLFARPMPAHEFEALLRQGGKLQAAAPRPARSR
jgi:EAL domain-containing protein (putative c-di-GMP-specific phosphodiesterase class I)